MMVNPLSVRNTLSSKFSAFNPRYLSAIEIEKKLDAILCADPLPLIKIISNHNFNIVERIIESQYSTLFIEPKNIRKHVLKVLVAKKTDTFVNKQERKKFIGTVNISADDILERFRYYSAHMSYAKQCDFHFTDEYITTNPDVVQTTLQLPVMPLKTPYVPFEVSDEEMLCNAAEFHDLFDKLSMEYFGEIK